MEPGADDELSTWRECRDCGLLQRLPFIPDGEVAACARCGCVLQRAARNSVGFARLCAALAALLLVQSLELPFIDLRAIGRFSASTLWTGPEMLRRTGQPGLGLVVIGTLIVMPAIKLGLELVVLFGARLREPPGWLPWLFGWLERVSPWSMVEVFLLGAFVAYTRLRALALVHVDVGPATLALGGVMLTIVAVDATLDREAIWQELEERGAHPRRNGGRPSAGENLIGCHVCGRVSRAEEGSFCTRCGHALWVRKRQSLERVWALLVTAVLLYVPANVLPVMTVERYGRGGASTIVRGVVELAETRLWPLALLVLLASIVVPLFKLVSMAWMLVLTHRRSDAWLVGRTRVFRFVHVIGRWSMIDIFMLATLVGVLDLGVIATVLPGTGAAAFCAVVLVTMVATEMFDPRLMWDAAGLGEERAHGKPVGT
jgi:paraquat-inducible protein A